MANGRIERDDLDPRSEFLINMFQDDPRLVEELKKYDVPDEHADEQGFNWQAALAYLFLLAWLSVIIYGAALAIDKGQI
jgi:hypothetical protein